MINDLNRSQGNSVYSVRDLMTPLVIVTFALFVRILFFSGAVGSDDLTYAKKAMDIAADNWDLSDYVGGQRYGLHLPMAMFMSVFGFSQFAANSFQLVSSLAEIVVLWWIAWRFFGHRIAVYSALILAIHPLHVNIAGRILADPPMNLFITSAFAFFVVAEKSRHIAWYVATGICLGLVFWTKSSVAVLIAPLFLVYAIYVRRFRIEWLWLVGSAAFISLGYILLLAILSGDPLFIVNSRAQAVDSALVSSGKDFSAWTYFKYLFVDIKHTGLLGPLALIGGFLLLRNRYCESQQSCFLFVLWGTGLVAILSFGVVSLDPLLFVPKQSNYMTIFAAPLCLFAAIAVDRLPGVSKSILLAAIIGSGFLLSAFEQQAVRVFVANSVAADQFAAKHPDKIFYGARPATSLSLYWGRVDGNNDPDAVGRILPIPDEEPRLFPPAGVSPADDINLVIDTETVGWSGIPGLSPPDIPDCWRQVAVLEPTGFGTGEMIVSALRQTADLGPGFIARKVKGATDQIYRPKPAFVYATPSDCSIQLK